MVKNGNKCYWHDNRFYSVIIVNAKCERSPKNEVHHFLLKNTSFLKRLETIKRSSFQVFSLGGKVIQKISTTIKVTPQFLNVLNDVTV